MNDAFALSVYKTPARFEYGKVKGLIQENQILIIFLRIIMFFFYKRSIDIIFNSHVFSRNSALNNNLLISPVLDFLIKTIELLRKILWFQLEL